MIELSERQAQTLELFIKGLTMREMALSLGVSYSRVMNILNEILIKTGLHSRKELFQKGKDIEFTVKND